MAFVKASASAVSRVAKPMRKKNAGMTASGSSARLVCNKPASTANALAFAHLPSAVARAIRSERAAQRVNGSSIRLVIIRPASTEFVKVSVSSARRLAWD